MEYCSRSIRWPRAAVRFGFVLALLSTAGPARADQGGVSFWLPGTFGSLSAVPGQPGWSAAMIYLHSSVEADGGVAASRAVRVGNRTTNLNVSLNASLTARVDAVAFAPAYTFATPVLGGQFTLGLFAMVGNTYARIDADVAGALGPLGFATSRSFSDSLFSYSDIYPQAMLKWNHGVHNFMVYGMTNFTIGDYDANRLVNIGVGHWAIDGGVGYTYFNPQTGWEFSAVTGLTWNDTNYHLDYQNGVDWHLDWAASRFLNKQWSVGVVGYAYHQITGDRGSGATFGDFKSRVYAIGPQVSYLFPVAGMQGVVNLKGFKEFGAEHRPEGWNVWLTLAISPAPPHQAAPPLTRKY